MLRRVAVMAFAPRMMVFPGGGVDPRDARPDLPWAGRRRRRGPRGWGARRGCARALVCAAVREVFEECGVLLAGPAPDDVVADLSDAGLGGRPAALLDREPALAELLLRRGLVLRSDLLSPRAVGSPRTSSRGATTPASSPRCCRTASRPTTSPARPTTPTGPTRPSCSRHGAAEARCMLPPTVVCVEEVAARRQRRRRSSPQRVPVRPVEPCRPGSGQDVVIRASLPR